MKIDGKDYRLSYHGSRRDVDSMAANARRNGYSTRIRNRGDSERSQGVNWGLYVHRTRKAGAKNRSRR